MRLVRLDPDAEAELTDATASYAARSPVAAKRFLASIRRMSRKVARSPLRFPVLTEPTGDITVRRALVPNFPYALVFVQASDEIHVLAVAHLRREPGYWLHRVKSTTE